jgi:hypothetical protein
MLTYSSFGKEGGSRIFGKEEDGIRATERDKAIKER